MRRPLAALLLGALCLAGIAPVAAGATGLPHVPLTGPKKPVLRLACGVVRHDGAPAVSCSWSVPPSRTALTSAASDGRRPAPHTFRLARAGRDSRTVVYRGQDTTFVDTAVRPGAGYAYRVQAFRADGRRIATSRTVRVAVPPVGTADRPGSEPKPDRRPNPGPEPDPAPAPGPGLRPAPTTDPRPGPRPEPGPRPDPTPRPDPRPKPGPDPRPAARPEPKPDPRPEPRPVPPVARMKLACTLHRLDPAAINRDVRAASAPAGPVVVCGWAAPSDLKIAGYRLWRAERPDGGREVIFKDREATRYADRGVSAGDGYVYAVEALDGSGRVIARSEAVPVTVPAPARPAA